MMTYTVFEVSLVAAVGYLWGYDSLFIVICPGGVVVDARDLNFEHPVWKRLA
jgi:hypothetical protein